MYLLFIQYLLLKSRGLVGKLKKIYHSMRGKKVIESPIKFINLDQKSHHVDLIN